MRCLKVIIVALMVGLLWAGCGTQKNPADGVGLAVLPSKVIVGPGPLRTCSDIVTGASTPSGTGPVIAFPKMRIDWTSTTHSLLISAIRVTVSGVGVKEYKSVHMISGDELTYLLGGSTLDPNTFVDISHQTETDSRGKDRNISPCNLVVFAIPLTNDTNTPSFKARVKVEVIGSALNADYTDQYFVRQFVFAQADYIKY